MSIWTRYRETSPLCDLCLKRNIIFLSIKPEPTDLPTRFICEECIRTIKDFYHGSYLETEDAKTNGLEWTVPLEIHNPPPANVGLATPRTATYELKEGSTTREYKDLDFSKENED